VFNYTKVSRFFEPMIQFSKIFRSAGVFLEWQGSSNTNLVVNRVKSN